MRRVGILLITGLGIATVWVGFFAVTKSPVTSSSDSKTSSPSNIIPLQTPGVARETLTVATNGSTWNTGTPDKPLATIQRALELAKPGTKIIVKEGKYTGELRSVRDGTAKEPIVIEAEGSVQILGSAGTSRLIEINHDYIQLLGLHINGLRGTGNVASDYIDKLIYVIGTGKKNGVEGLKLDKLTIENAGGECVRLRYFAVNNEISNSTIRNCGVYDYKFIGDGKNGEGIYIGTATEQRGDGKNPTSDPDQSRSNWIHDNNIDTQGNECVDIKEAAYENLVENNSCTGQKDPNSAGFDSRGDRNTFKNNKVANVSGAGFRLGGDEENDGVQNNVQNNSITNAAAGGIKATRFPQGVICGNTFSGIDEDELFVGMRNKNILNKPCNT